jgi:hypothetical protein
MILAELFDKRVKKNYLVLRESYRNSKGKPAVRNIKSFGQINNANREELMKKALSEKNMYDSFKSTITISKIIGKNNFSNNANNLGYVILEKIFNTLNINNFISKNIKKRNDAFDLNSTIKLLVYSRILNPDSKLETFNGKDGFFGNPFKDIKLDNIYDSLIDCDDEYDENGKPLESRYSGVSKENRETPIVQFNKLRKKIYIST